MAPPIGTLRPAAGTPPPLPALVAHSDNDPFASVFATRQLAADSAVPTWSCPGRGHLNAESALGDWPEGIDQLRQLAGMRP